MHKNTCAHVYVKSNCLQCSWMISILCYERGFFFSFFSFFVGFWQFAHLYGKDSSVSFSRCWKEGCAHWLCPTYSWYSCERWGWVSLPTSWHGEHFEESSSLVLSLHTLWIKIGNMFKKYVLTLLALPRLTIYIFAWSKTVGLIIVTALKILANLVCS